MSTTTLEYVRNHKLLVGTNVLIENILQLSLTSNGITAIPAEKAEIVSHFEAFLVGAHTL